MPGIRKTLFECIKSQPRALLVLCLVSLLSGCFEQVDGRSAWVSERRDVWNVALPDAEEVYRTNVTHETVVSTDPVNRFTWFLNTHGVISRFLVSDDEIQAIAQVPHTRNGRQMKVAANPINGGVFVLYRGKLTHFTQDAEVISSINKQAIDIAFDPVRQKLWIVDSDSIVAYSQSLEEVHRYDISGNRRNTVRAFDIEPASGDLYVQLKRSILHLNSTAELLATQSSRDQSYLAVSRADAYYTARRNYVTQFALDGSQQSSIRVPNRKSVVAMETDWQTGELWVLTKDMLYRLHNGSLHEVYPQDGGSRYSRRRSGRHFKHLTLMSDVPPPPDVQIIEPPEESLLPLLATVSIELSNVWYAASANNLKVIVDAVEVDSNCTVVGGEYQCEFELDSNQFNPSVQVSYASSTEQQTVSAVVMYGLDANGNGVVDADDDDDNDGLSNKQEQDLGTDRLLPDTDGDLLPDGLEIALNLNPLSSDSNANGVDDGEEDFDNDGLINRQELTFNTDLQNPDTDSDGLQDGLEVQLTLDPTKPDSDGDGISDFDTDSDGDGLSNGLELLLSLDPVQIDSDGNGVNDGDEDSDGDGITNVLELLNQLDPNDPADGQSDRDGDGLSNGMEIINGLNPDDASDAMQDRDGDGLSNADEVLVYATNLNISDTDGDGLDDGLEVRLELQPTLTDSDGDGLSDADEDADGDQLSNLSEVQLGTDPLNVDSDNDGLQDGLESELGLDPTLIDTDANGVSDGDEDSDGDGLSNLLELANGLNPALAMDADADADGDGLSNKIELLEHQTNPNKADSDEDGLDDKLELELELSPINTDTDGDGVQDGDEDYDADDLSNLDELANNSDPANADTDGDGLRDGLEVALGLFPDNADSDADGVADGDEDHDTDGLSNSVELSNGLNPDDAQDADADADGDGLSNKTEILVHGSDINKADTDEDGLPDGLEVSLSLNPTEADSDGNGTLDGDEDLDADGLSNTQELQYGTDLNNADTDSDGLNDGVEIALSLNPTQVDSDDDGISDSEEDSDGDQIANAQEILAGLDPSDAADAELDADADGLNNRDELLVHGTNINDADTDNDSLTDGLEIALGLDPTLTDSDANGVDDALEDSDGDGLSNQQELLLGIDPSQADTDGDGLSDGLEVELGLNPDAVDSNGNGVNDGDEDSDADGLTNIDELLIHQSNPNQFDSDGDGLGDGSEVTLGLDPTNGDSDGDGTGDGTDLYPSDPNQSLLAAVENIGVTKVGTSLEVVWGAHTDIDKVSGYQVYRREYGGEPVGVLTAGRDRVGFTDDSGNNGTLYEYQVTAVDTNGEFGDASEWVPIFLSYNQIDAGALIVARDDNAVTLQWDTSSVDAYRVFRSLSAAPESFSAIIDHPLQTGESMQTYSDLGTDVANPYYYRIATLLSFVNPQSGQTVVEQGPLSTIVNVDAFRVYKLQLSLLNVEQLSDSSYRKLIEGDSDRTLTGQYSDARGDVRVTATNTDTNAVETTVTSNGEFSLALPTDGQYSIVAQDLHPTQSSNTLQLSLLLVSDSSQPQVTIASDQMVSTDESELLLRGTAIDADSPIRDVYASSDRYPDVDFQGNIGADGEFTVSVPLLHGPNDIDVFAVDSSGNIGTTAIILERAASVAPVLVIDEPIDGSSTEAERIVVRGSVYTDQAINQVSVRVNGFLATVTGDSPDDGYQFESLPVQLDAGLNSLVATVTSPGGTIEKTINLTQLTDDLPPVVLPPSLQISKPLAGTVSNVSNINVQGTVYSGSSSTSLLISGVPVSLSSAGEFNTVVSLDSCDGAETQITLLAIDSFDQSSEKTISVSCDNERPIIDVQYPQTLNGNTVNQIIENPMRLTGVVEDRNLVGVEINGQSVTTVPATTTGQYRFSASVQLNNGEETELTISARDRAGNETTLSYTVLADLPVAIEIISPSTGTSIAFSGEPIELETIAQVTGLDATQQVLLTINDGSAIPMNLAGDTASLVQTITLLEGENTLLVEVVNDNNDVVTRARRSFVSEPVVVAPLALLRSDPEAQSQHQLPNYPINLFFNQNGVDIDQVEVIVTQSVHGQIYDLSDQAGAGFTEIAEPTLVEVHKDHEVVDGEIARYPGDGLVSFYPAEPFYYGATVYVELNYAGQNLSRFSYTVQELPTLINGIVTNLLGEPLSGIDVSIPELSLQTTTNDHGNFDFGAGQIQSVAIGSGRYTLLINEDQVDPSWGVLEFWANVQKSRINNLGRFQLPKILRDTPYVPIAGGKPVSLFNGAVTLDLTDASVRFPDGRNQGNAQVQMLLASQLPHSATEAAVPQFAWHLQPSGIEVEGEVSLTINIPPFRGGYAHVPPSETRVVLLGYDKDAKQLAPIGTGRVDGRKIHSIGELNLKSLDYVSYAIVPISVYESLWEWERGEISTIRQLHSELLEAAQ